MRSINPLIISRHISKKHRGGIRTLRTEINTLYDDVSLQTRTHRAHGVEQQYWVVKRNGSLTRLVAGGETYALLELTHKREWDRLESDARARAQCPGHRRAEAGVIASVDGPYALAYDGVRRDILLDIAAMPYAGTIDHALGDHLNSGEAAGRATADGKDPL